MKQAIWLAVLAVVSTSAQDVFVLGGPGTTPVPPIVYQPPVIVGGSTVTYQTVQPVVAAVPVVSASVYSTSVYPTAPCYGPGYGYYNPNVVYIGGPGSCGPTYYDYPPCSTRNIIYFGREQSYRQGYHFRGCR